MQQFIGKFEKDIEGTLSGFDRVLFRGSLPRLSYSDGMKREIRVTSSIWPIANRPQVANLPHMASAAGLRGRKIVAAREETDV